MYDPIKNDYQAYVSALTHAELADTVEESRKCVSTAQKFSVQLSNEDREKGKQEADSMARWLIGDIE